MASNDQAGRIATYVKTARCTPGFTVRRGKRHYVVRNDATGQQVTVAMTPSDGRRAALNARAQLRRLGLRIE